MRHGESEGNVSNVHQPETSALSLDGLRQADRLAQRFIGVQAQKIIASPVMRTKQTAEAIAKETGLEIEYDERLKEKRNPSVVVGKKYFEPHVQKVWRAIDASFHDPQYHYSDEENFFDLKERISGFINELVTRNETDLILVSHGFAIRTFVGCVIFGEIFSSQHFLEATKHLAISNTGITICDYDEERGWRVSVINDAAHLLD